MRSDLKAFGKSSFPARRSRAFTLLEVILAATLLAMLLVASVQMLRALSASRRASERRTVALEAVQAVSDQISNIPWSELSPRSAERVAVPDPLRGFLPDSMLTVTVNDEAQPTAKRIQVELTWKGPDGAVAPVRVTSWAFPERSRPE